MQKQLLGRLHCVFRGCGLWLAETTCFSTVSQWAVGCKLIL